MKYIKAISVGDRGSKEDAEAFLKSFGVDPAIGSLICVMGAWKWYGTFDADDPRWTRLTEWERSQGHEPFIVHRIEYSPTELRSAPMLEFNFDVQLKGEIGPSQGTKYDLIGACPCCKSGATVIPPFYMTASALPKNRMVAESHQGIPLVCGNLLQELQHRAGSQSWLIPVADSKSGRALPWAAILPRATLPRMEMATKGFFRYTKPAGHEWGPCLCCDQDNWSTTMKTPFQPVYSRSKVHEACESFIFLDQEFPDAAATWERTFAGARPGNPDKVSTPLIFVNQPVYQILLKHAGKYVRATPATLIE